MKNKSKARHQHTIISEQEVWFAVKQLTHEHLDSVGLADVDNALTNTAVTHRSCVLSAPTVTPRSSCWALLEHDLVGTRLGLDLLLPSRGGGWERVGRALLLEVKVQQINGHPTTIVDTNEPGTGLRAHKRVIMRV